MNLKGHTRCLLFTCANTGLEIEAYEFSTPEGTWIDILHTPHGLKFTPQIKVCLAMIKQAGAGEVYFASLLSPGVFYWLADLVWPIPHHCSSSLMTGRPGTSNTFNGSVRGGQPRRSRQ